MALTTPSGGWSADRSPTGNDGTIGLEPNSNVLITDVVERALVGCQPTLLLWQRTSKSRHEDVPKKRKPEFLIRHSAAGLQEADQTPQVDDLVHCRARKRAPTGPSP
jgi:hypothetical protein